MKEDILNGNYNDPFELDSYAESRIDGFGENVEKLSKSLKENTAKYMRKRKNNQEDPDEDELKDQYPKNRHYRPVEGIKDPWNEDQSFIWPDYEAEAFEREIESFRARPESNTGYNNRALNKKMTDMYGEQAKKCIKNTLFKESRARRPLKESENNPELDAKMLKKYEEQNYWYFVDDEDFPAINNLAEAFGEAVVKTFPYFKINQFNPKTKNPANNNIYIEVHGYGYKGAVSEYRLIARYDEPDNTNWKDKSTYIPRPELYWRRQQHLKTGYTHENHERFIKFLKKSINQYLGTAAVENGFEVTNVNYDRCRRYDDTSYLYIEVKPTAKLNAIANSPVEKKLQKVVDRIVKNFNASKLAEVDGKTYWISHSGYEGSEVIFSTHLAEDSDKYYDTDGDDEYVKNDNYKKPILYLDAPNLGYCNWNSGAGYIKGDHVKTLDDIIDVAEKFVRYLKDVGRDVYDNSNY